MSQQSSTAITTQAKASVRSNAATIAGGVGGASVVALLAVASVFGPVLATGVSVATVAAWLGGLGGNALAGWLTQWAERNLARFESDDPDREQHLLEQLARDLTAQLGQNSQIASDVEVVLLQTDALQVAVDALAGQSDQQVRLLQQLIQYAQDARGENHQLHQATVSAVRQQVQVLLDSQAQGNVSLAAQLHEILAAMQRAETAANKPASNSGGISNWGSVGRVQSVNISGGTVGSIIGEQRNYYGSSPAAGAPTQDDVQDMRELLALQRGQLAIHVRKAGRGDAAAAQQATQTQDEIARLKAQLRAWGQMVADEPGDEG